MVDDRIYVSQTLVPGTRFGWIRISSNCTERFGPRSRLGSFPAANPVSCSQSPGPLSWRRKLARLGRLPNILAWRGRFQIDLCRLSATGSFCNIECTFIIAVGSSVVRIKHRPPLRWTSFAVLDGSSGGWGIGLPLSQIFLSQFFLRHRAKRRGSIVPSPCQPAEVACRLKMD